MALLPVGKGKENKGTMIENIGTGIPANYDYINLYNATQNPSSVHVTNTGLQWYFRRYLLTKAMSVFKWKLPDNWYKPYFMYVLYCWGFVGVVNTDKFGVICQAGSLKGYGVYYQPTHMVIANPLLTGILEPAIDKQCAVIKLQPDYGGVLDRINFYADMLALSAETAGIDLVNSKLAYVFAASNKAQGEAFKKLFDQIAGGTCANVIDKQLFNDDGTPNWLMFNQNLRDTYIAGDILEDMRKWELKFDTDFGIPNSNTDKKERLIVDEVNSNNIEVRCWSDVALETLKEGCEKANAMFGLDIQVEYRVERSDDNGAGVDVSTGSVQVR